MRQCMRTHINAGHGGEFAELLPRHPTVRVAFNSPNPELPFETIEDGFDGCRTHRTYSPVERHVRAGAGVGRANVGPEAFAGDFKIEIPTGGSASHYQLLQSVPPHLATF